VRASDGARTGGRDARGENGGTRASPPGFERISISSRAREGAREARGGREVGWCGEGLTMGDGGRAQTRERRWRRRRRR